MEGLKCCPKCNVIKSLDDFHNNKSNRGGKAYYCKPCNSACTKPKTKEQSARDTKKYRELNPEKIKDIWQVYYSNNKKELSEKRKVYDKQERRIESQKKWRIENRDRLNELRRERKKNPTPKFKIDKILRDRFNKVIIRMKSGKKFCSHKDLIGCTIDELKGYLEDNFTEGMEWGNHGNGDNKWNIDHIRPLCTYNLFDINEQKKAFHYSNLRPLWFKENMTRERQTYSIPLT